MKKLKQSSFIVILACMAIACSQSQKNYEVMEAAANEERAADESSAPLSSSAAMETNNDPNRKFIRTADIRFKVKDVIQSVYRIEDIAVSNGGFVTNSYISGERHSTQTINISEDSALLVTRYVVTGRLTLRIPNTQLDATLKAIAPLVDYLDYRQVTADDVALQMFANKLTQQRLDKNQRRLENAIDNRGRRLEETTSAEEILMNAQEKADQAKVANLSLAEQVSFSTVTLSLYQNSSTKKEIIEREKEIEPYKPSLGSRISQGLSGGWELICVICVAISYMWGIILAVALVFIGYRIYRKYRATHKD